MIRLHKFDSRAGMVAAMVDKTTTVLQEGTRGLQKTTWAVSGGSTPKPLFQAMAHADLPWERVDIALVDERWVTPGHPRSNESFMIRELNTGNSAKARFVGMRSADADPFKAQETVEARYQSLPAFGPLLLGLGGDGHTASLFPKAKGLEDALTAPALTAALQADQSAVTGYEVDRMSLTAHAIKGAVWPHLMITGAGKLQTLEAAISQGKWLPKEEQLPIYRLLSMLDTPLDVYWAA